MYCICVISKNVELTNELIEYNKIAIVNEENVKKYINEEIDMLIIEDEIVQSKYLEQLCNHSKYILLQDNVNLNIKLEKNSNVITFGFNHKSTVTVSSISEEKIVICVQREIKSFKNKSIEPQELTIKNEEEYDINIKIIKKIIQEILEK